MAMSYRLIFVVVITIIIIAFVNSMTKPYGYGKIYEGFDCASQTDLLGKTIDTGSYIQDIRDTIKTSGFTTNHIYTNAEVLNIMTMLTNVYGEIKVAETSTDQSKNPFYGIDVVNLPKSCGCRNAIMSNYENVYKGQTRYNLTDLTAFFSILRYFFDIEDPSNNKVYTGLGNYTGSYNQDYYNTFLGGKETYTVPAEITNETTYLISDKYKYHLNYFSKYLLIHSSSIHKKDILTMIINAANTVMNNYNGIYDTNLNPFPGKSIHTNELLGIIDKARYKTFTDWKAGVCTGNTLNPNAQKILTAITDKKYFVAYVKAVIKAIQGQTSKGTYQDWDPQGLIINDVSGKDTMLLTDDLLLSNSADNVFNLMEKFGHFDKLSNVYTLNTTGNSIVQQMSIDAKNCTVDYLDRMCVLIFVPIQYGEEVKYDGWGFFQ